MKALELLEALTRRFPVDGEKRHALALSDKEPGCLMLMIQMPGGGWFDLDLEESDFDKDPAALAEEIAVEIEKVKPGVTTETPAIP